MFQLEGKTDLEAICFLFPQNRPELTKPDQNRTQQNKTDQNRPEPTKPDQNRTKQTRTDQNQPKQTKTDKK